MSLQTWRETLVTAQVDGTAVANSTTAATLLPATARITLPSGYFSAIGKMLKVTAYGRCSTVVTTPGTLTLDLRLGTVASPIVVFNGGAMNLNVTAQTNATWKFEAELTARSLGSGTSANLMGGALFSSRALIGSAAVAAGYAGSALLPDTAPAVGTGFDSTITNVVDFFATWSVANASNSIQLHGFTLESLN
jgi:hypothetical protein